MKKLILLAASTLLVLVALVVGVWVMGSDARPWINAPLSQATSGALTPRQVQEIAARDPSLLVAVTLSGGGVRAAALGWGVLRELEATKFEWGGRKTNLLDAVDVIAGVSGGSIMAAHYAAFGAAGLPDFQRDFLYGDFQKNVITDALHPRNLFRLTSPWFGRSHIVAERLDQLFQGRTFGDVMRKHRHPQLLISATDAAQGAVFDFTSDQMALICSDIADVPLSFAVAASSSVPVLLSPMTLKNHSEVCQKLGIAQYKPQGPALDYQSRLYELQRKSYLDGKARPFIHLVDGAVADNLGIRRLLDRALAGDGIREGFAEVAIAPGMVKGLVLVTVNAEGDPTATMDDADELPQVLTVLDAIRYSAVSRRTHETQQLLADLARQWGDGAQARPSGFNVFAPDARIYTIQVNLRDGLDKADNQTSLMKIPTSLSLPRAEVDRLIAAGRTALHRSAAFQSLRKDLGVLPD